MQLGVVLPEYIVLKELDYFDCLLLTDEDYKAKTLQMIEYAKQAKYKLSEYMTIYYYASRFDNVLDISLDELVVNLKSAMTRIAENPQLIKEQSLSQFDFERNISSDEAVENIRKHGLSICIESKNKNEKVETDNLIYYITKGLNDLYNKYRDNDSNFKLKIDNSPILESVDPGMLADSLLVASPFSVDFFASFLSERYPKIEYRKEGKTLYDLKERIAKHLVENQQKSLLRYSLKSLHTTILQIEDKHAPPSIA